MTAEMTKTERAFKLALHHNARKIAALTAAPEWGQAAIDAMAEGDREMAGYYIIAAIRADPGFAALRTALGL